LHQGVRQLTFACDPALRPYEVSVRNLELEAWEFQPAPGPQAPASLVVRFRDPVMGPLPPLRIRGQVSLQTEAKGDRENAGSVWTGPGLRLVGGVPRGETLTVRVPADLCVEDWQPGDFSLSRAGTEPGGAQVLTLTSHGPRRPSARLRPQGVEWRVRQSTWWQVGLQGATLTSQITYEVEHGHLFRLPVRPPPRWVVEQVQMSPPGLLRGWDVVAAEGEATLVADLQQAMGPGNPGRLLIRLKSAAEPPGADGRGRPLELDFPDLVPEGSPFREGAFGISVDPAFESAARSPVEAGVREPTIGLDPRTLKPWGTQLPEYLYPLQRQPLTGTLQLRPRRARVRAQCTSEVVVAGGHAALRTRLSLAPELGQPDTIDYFLTAAVAEAGPWTVLKGSNAIRHAERLSTAEALAPLLALGSCHPVQAAGLAAFRLPGGLWRLTLAQPLREPLVLEAASELLPSAGRLPKEARLLEAPHWDVPLLLVPAAERTDGEVLVRLAGADLVEVEGQGLREQSPLARDGRVANGSAEPPWRKFAYQQPPVSLLLYTQPKAADRSGEALAEQAHLATYVDPAGPPRHHFQFTIRNWQQRTLPVLLPAGCRPRAVAVNGRRVGAVRSEAVEDNAILVSVPIPASATDHHCEILYVGVRPSWGVWATLEAPAPELPIHALAFRRTWHLSPTLTPLSESRLQQAGGPNRAPWSRLPRALPVPDSAGEPSPEEEQADVPTQPSAADPSLQPQDPPGWQEWEPRAGTWAGDSLTVVEQRFLTGLTVAVSLLLLLAAWLARTFPVRARAGLLLGWLAVGGVVWLWMPTALQRVVAWPLAGGWLLAAAWYIGASWVDSLAWLKRAPVAVALGLLVLAAAGVQAVAPGAPGATTVWLVPGPAGAPEKLNVLAPPELLDQMEALCQRGGPSPRGAVLLAAHYDGRAGRGTATFEADYRVHCFRDEPVTVALPLGSVELQEATLDGLPAYPQVLPGPQQGYTLSVKGKGPHALRVRFVVRSVTTGDDREVRFAIPELVQNRLVMRLPAECAFVQAPVGRGAQQVQADTGAVTLEADLGRVGNLVVRWRQDRKESPSAEVHVKEKYLWELRPNAGRLLAVLQYAVARGSLCGMEIDLPESLEVRRVDAGPLAGGGVHPRLKEWSSSAVGDNRRLRLELQGPVTEGVQVFLELLPRRPLPSGTPLPLPAPVQAVPQEGLLAFRAEGLEASVAEVRRLNGREPEVFHRAWQGAEVEDPGTPAMAYTFHRAAGAAPMLRLNWSVPAPRGQARHEIAWQIGPRQVEFQARARWTDPDEALALAEWELPPDLVLADVRGTGVRNWSRQGNRLQVWLQRSTGELALQLIGSLPRRPGEAVVSLPPIRSRTLPLQTDSLRVTAQAGTLLELKEARNLKPGSRSGDWEYQASGSDYSLAFETRPDTAPTRLEIVTFAEVVERRLRFTAYLDGHTSPAGGRTLTVRLRHWAGADATLEAPAGTRRRELRRDAATRTWVLELPPQPAGRFQIRLTGSRPWESGEDPLMPEVSIQEPISHERWLAVSGSELRAEETRGLAAVPDGGPLARRWPPVADRVRRTKGTVWRVASDDWRLRLGSAVDTPRVELILEEQSAAVLDGQRWTHRGTWRLFQRGGGDLQFLLPAGATVLAVTVDGVFLAPRQPGPDRLWLPLPAGSGVREVRLLWVFEDDRESLERPLLDRPRLQGMPPAPVLWAVDVPAGYRLVDEEGGAVRASATAQSLRRAGVFLQASRLLTEHPPSGGDATLQDALREVQRQFYLWCRTAQQQVSSVGGLPEEGPGPEALEQWLGALQDQNRELAAAQHFEEIRAAADESTPRPPTERSPPGQTIYWQALSGAPGLRLSLASVEAESLPWKVVASLVLLLVPGGLYVLGYFPRALDWARLLWPEELAALGLLGWQFGVYEDAAAALILVAIVGRMLQVLLWLRGVRAGSEAVPPQAAGPD
jgi:hypothetical protein